MKRMMAFLLASTIVGGSVLVGCGDDTKTNSTGNSGTTPIALENIPASMGDAFCGLAFSCCTAMEQSAVFKDFPSVPKTVEECGTFISAQFEMFVFANLKDGVNAGRLKYDGDVARTCFESIQGNCAVLKQSGPFTGAECAKVFVGQVADGGECAQENECAVAGSYCPIPQGAMLGKCAVLPKEGEPCPNLRCAEGLGCGSVNGMDVCVKPGPDGQACTSSLECTSKYCDFMTAKCAQPKAIGDTCFASYECKDAYCDSVAKICTALKAEGDACASFTECASNDCGADMKCAPGEPACDGT